MSYKIKIETEAHQDIQDGIKWYNEQQPGLGRRFHIVVKAALEKLKSNPSFRVRYNNVHCLPLKKFPYMLHFTIDEENKLVIIRGIFNTSRNPQIWKSR